MNFNSQRLTEAQTLLDEILLHSLPFEITRPFSLLYTPNCLYSTSTFFCCKILWHLLPLSSILTSFLRNLSFSSIWPTISPTSPLHDLMLFNVSRMVYFSNLLHWNSLTIFLANHSAPLLNISVMRITKSRTARNVSLCSVPLDVYDSTDSYSMPGKALSRLCCCIACPSCTSYTTDASNTLGPHTSHGTWPRDATG